MSTNSEKKMCDLLCTLEAFCDSSPEQRVNIFLMKPLRLLITRSTDTGDIFKIMDLKVKVTDVIFRKCTDRRLAIKDGLDN